MDQGDQILLSLRQIMQAVDRQSRKLLSRHGMTGPQALLLKQLLDSSDIPVGELAARINLTQATVTEILIRLEKKGWVCRSRSDSDKRKMLVSLTEVGNELIKSSPPLLQEKFLSKFNHLEQWEQTQLLANVQKIASMMNADNIDAVPLLVNEPISNKDTENISEQLTSSSQPEKLHFKIDTSM